MYRCRECRERFSARVAGESPERKARRSKREAIRKEVVERRRLRSRREMMVYGVALMVFIVFLYVITRERGGAG
jgi:hypothetical protein